MANSLGMRVAVGEPRSAIASDDDEAAGSGSRQALQRPAGDQQRAQTYMPHDPQNEKGEPVASSNG